MGERDRPDGASPGRSAGPAPGGAATPSQPRGTGGSPSELCDALVDPVIAARAGRIAYVNPAAGALFGADAAALVGRRLADVVAPRSHDLGGADLDRQIAAHAALPAGSSFRAAVLRGDGIEIDVEVSAGLLADGHGGEGVVITLRRLRESVALGDDERHRLVFENAPLGILHFDERAVLTACNDAFVSIIGSTKRLLIGLNLLTLHDREIVGCLRSALAGKRAHYEGDYRSATSGKVTPVRVVFAPIVAASGQAQGGVGIVEDIGERKRLQGHLAQVDRMASVGTLAAGVAHEINNPLAYVMANLDMAARRVGGAGPDFEDLAAVIASAREGADRVSVIVRDLRIFSRITDEERRIPIEIVPVIESTIHLAQGIIKERARLVKEYEPVPSVLGDESRLGQVFLNLLVNAAQAIPEGHPDDHRITLRTRREGGRAVVEVIDTGSGIDPRILGRVFEPFVTTKPVGVGTGLGLSICHGIVTALGGEITAESEVGRGSTFKVSLPANEQRSVPLAPPSPPPARTRRLKILIVDDEDALARALHRDLGSRHDVTTALGGREALAALREGGPFDLVLCDVMMPDVSGIDLYEDVRASDPATANRFVFMTGGAFTERARGFLESVPNARLEKPFGAAEIDAVVRPPARPR